MNRRILMSCVLLGMLLSWQTGTANAQPPVILSSGHIDVFAAAWEAANGPPANPSLPDPRWFIHAHDEDNDVEYAPSAAIFFVKPQALTSRPSGSQWDFTGTGAGGNLWVLPQTQNVDLLFAGVATEEIDPGTFLTYSVTDSRINNGSATSAEWVHFRLRSVNGPGLFSMWQTDGFGNPVVWIANADGIGATDFVTLPVGAHAHYNWGFTAAGIYEIGIEVTALLPNGDTSLSGEVIYTFAVNAVPEPGSLALLGFGACGLAGYQWRRWHHLRIRQMNN